MALRWFKRQLQDVPRYVGGMCVRTHSVARVCDFDAFDWRLKGSRLCLDKTFHQTFKKIYSHLRAWCDSSPNNCQKTQSSLPLSGHPYSVYTLTHLFGSVSSSVAHELPLPYLHPSLTSHVPHAPPWCQLTLAHSHIAVPFDPLAACRSAQDLRPATASVLVCHRSLSGRSVIDGSWWAALTHRAAALGLVVWGSIDYDALRDRGQSGLSGRRRGKTKDGEVMDEVLLVNVMRFDLCSIDHGRIFIWKWFISTRWANGCNSKSPHCCNIEVSATEVWNEKCDTYRIGNSYNTAF